ncbi:MAG: hypothetical protein ACUVWR_15075, partial [Anaerolineae bacterium]
MWVRKVVIAFSVLYAVGLALVLPPILSYDVYHYALYGRMMAFHGVNPYFTTGSAIPFDLFYEYTSWRLVPSRYGPVWTLVSALLAGLGGQDVLKTLLAFKGLCAASQIA